MQRYRTGSATIVRIATRTQGNFTVVAFVQRGTQALSAREGPAGKSRHAAAGWAFMGFDSNSRKDWTTSLPTSRPTAPNSSRWPTPPNCPHVSNRVALLDKGKPISLTGRNALAHKMVLPDHAIPVFTTFPTAGKYKRQPFWAGHPYGRCNGEIWRQNHSRPYQLAENKGERWLLKRP